MAAPTSFTGWVGRSAEAAKGKLEWTEYQPKGWEETDIDIEISHCGICGSDLHTMSNGWGATKYPAVVGHEIVGKAVRVGRDVPDIKVGDRVGVGAQSDACFNRWAEKPCVDCADGQEQFCKVGRVGTYNGVYPNGDRSFGGYSQQARVPYRLAFKIPDGLASEDAAPMLCAGVTTWSPLRRLGCGPGKSVGVVGIGGLGHFGLLWARALGADSVVAITRSRAKEADAIALGAHKIIATGQDDEWDQVNSKSLDIIISTVSDANMPLSRYLGLLKTGGQFVVLGLPDKGELPPISAFDLVRTGVSISGSMVGSGAEIREMLEFAAKKGVKPWVNVRPMEEANAAIVDFEAGKQRYRYVLEV